jgi:glutamate synthase domain-containing protein 3
VLRSRFTGKPEHVIRFFFYVAEEVRLLLSTLGFRTLREAIGRVDRIRTRDLSSHWKASRLDFSDVLMRLDPQPGVDVYKTKEQDHGLESALDRRLIEICKPALESRTPVEATVPVRNLHRTIGAMLAGEVARRYGAEGLPSGTIKLQFSGSAGQSFGAFITHGMELTLVGDANDYVGKGMSGGIIAVRHALGTTFASDENILIGNTVLYGATGGKAFFSGVAGERFAVRNSGSTAVVEGVGDHGCEYMTGGCVVVIGATGRNFAAGMSGGYAYVLDEQGDFAQKCNTELVDISPVMDNDADLLRSLLEEHVARTGSVKASRLLEHWNDTVARFVRIIPGEYRRVLEAMKSVAAAE